MSRDWSSYFSDLSANTNLLDVGTGNGTLALLAWQSFSRRNLPARITGIDAAEILPDVSDLGSSTDEVEILFKGRMPAEALTLEDKKFDEVVGQYALEYSNTKRSVPEIVRVLAPEGRVRFLVHSNDSLVIKNASEDHQALDELLNDLALVRRARRVFKARIVKANRVKSPKAADQKFQKTLEELQGRIQVVDPATSSQHYQYFLKTMSDLFQRRVSQNPNQYLTFLDQFDDEMQSSMARLSQMAEAAKDEEGAEGLLKLFAEAGLVGLTLQKQASSGTTFGWLIQGHKA